MGVPTPQKPTTGIFYLNDSLIEKFLNHIHHIHIHQLQFQKYILSLNCLAELLKGYLLLLRNPHTSNAVCLCVYVWICVQH